MATPDRSDRVNRSNSGDVGDHQHGSGSSTSGIGDTKPGASGLRRIRNAFQYSRQGLISAIRHEAAFRQELILVVVLVPLALWLPFSPLEQVLLIGSLLLVLIVELLNSAIEAVVDLTSPRPHPLAGRAKDMGSAAVLLSILLAVLTWLAVATPVLLGRFG